MDSTQIKGYVTLSSAKATIVVVCLAVFCQNNDYLKHKMLAGGQQLLTNATGLTAESDYIQFNIFRFESLTI